MADRLPGIPDVGARFAHYELRDIVGHGGMGVVFRARDERLDREVALKILASDLAADPEFRGRFLAESKAAAAIEHPNVLPVYEAGSEGAVLYIASRLVQGPDLRELLRRDAPLEPGRTAALIRQIGGALDAAHHKGLVHRDVKPANVLVDRALPGEHCYLTDFGVAKRLSGGPELTAPGKAVGTLRYAAPEQVEGGRIDARVDVYALGCILFECLTARPPYLETDGHPLIWAHANAAIPRITAIRRDLNGEVDQVVAIALAKHPRERFGSGRDLTDALFDAIGGRETAGHSARPVDVDGGFTPTASHVGQAGTEARSRFSARMFLRAIGLVLIYSAVFALSFLLLRGV